MSGLSQKLGSFDNSVMTPGPSPHMIQVTSTPKWQHFILVRSGLNILDNAEACQL